MSSPSCDAMSHFYTQGDAHDGHAFIGAIESPDLIFLHPPQVTFARCTRVYEYETRMCRSLGEDDDERR